MNSLNNSESGEYIPAPDTRKGRNVVTFLATVAFAIGVHEVTNGSSTSNPNDSAFKTSATDVYTETWRQQEVARIEEGLNGSQHTAEGVIIGYTICEPTVLHSAILIGGYRGVLAIKGGKVKMEEFIQDPVVNYLGGTTGTVRIVIQEGNEAALFTPSPKFVNDHCTVVTNNS